MVNALGSPTDCKIVIPSGADDLDLAACKALLKRARFKPAKDAQGNAIASAYRNRVVWLPNAAGPNFWFHSPDLVVSTPELANQLNDTAEVLVVSGPADSARSCYIFKSVGSAKLDELACSVVQDPRFAPPITEKDEQVRGVRLLRVGFQNGETLQVRVR